MNCTNCGNPLPQGTAFCPGCGAVPCPPDGRANPPKGNPEKHLWRGLFLSIAMTLAVLMAGCSGQDSSGKMQGSRLDKNILLVQAGHPNLIPDITYQAAYSHFFGNPQWRGFRADDGSDVVEFSGECTYGGESAAVYIQFLIEDETSFSMHHVSLDVGDEAVPVDIQLFLELSYKPFASYSEDVLGTPMEQTIQDAFSQIFEEITD